MSTAIWGEPKPVTDDQYLATLLKKLLYSMMKQLAAQGACVALYDDTIGQMVIRLHVRFSGECPGAGGTDPELASTNPSVPARRMSTSLASPDGPAPEQTKRQALPADALEIVQPAHENALFPVGSAYPPGKDLVGYLWRKNEVLVVRHENYLAARESSHLPPLQDDVTPTCYLAVPIREPLLTVEEQEHKTPLLFGVVILYQTVPGPGFQMKQRPEAMHHAERIALYLQNDHLRRLHMRTREHMKRLKQISATFPTTVKLSNLVEDIYRFISSTVDASSVLLTFYDRDTNKIYDVFAVDKGRRIEGLHEQPVIVDPNDRPRWWHATQKDKRTLLLVRERQENGEYGANEELLKGTWGDQTGAETFLLLPMKMFTRVVGSLCITSTRPNAYSPLEILVLETMVQIITVSIENAKLYDRSRQAVETARRREESLAVTLSALQTISAVLNLNELLRKFVKTVADLVKADMCSFFQLSADEEELVAQAIFDRTGKWNGKDAARSRNEHDELIRMIRLPFKGSLLQRLVEAESFFYVEPAMVEEIAQESGEGGIIFLHETRIKNMLMIPVRYQNEIVGVVAVHTPGKNHLFRPQDVGVLMAIAAQAASAIRNAQLFEEIQEAYAELQRMDRIKDEFIVTASHELRTPLSAISGYSTLLKRQAEGERVTAQHVLKYATKLVSSSQQLSDLVDNMTQAAKYGALDKKLELQLTPIQMLAAVETSVNMLSINVEQKITVEVDGDLWVSSDALRLRQIITNLLDNAAKYSPPEGRILLTAHGTRLSKLPEGQVDYAVLAAGEDPPIVHVRVCDEGEGISSEDVEKIFDKFVRAPRSLTTPVRGTGLGLFISRRFVEAMGGKLWLERSIPGSGSIFSFYLLRVPAPLETREQDEPESEYSAP